MNPESPTYLIDQGHPQPARPIFPHMRGVGAVFLLTAMLMVAGCGGKGNLSGSATTSTANGSGGSGNSGTGGGTGGNGSGSGGGAAQSSGTTISNVRTASGNWQSFGQIGPKFADCPATCSEATWQQVFGISSPSKSGHATEFDLNPKLPAADVLFTAGLIGTTSPQLPDGDHELLPTLHNFTYDADFYVTDASTTSALEFDVSLFMEGITGITFGTQRARLQDGDRDIWNNGTEQWVSSGVPCRFANGWNHVTLTFQRQSNNDTLYQTIALNGTTNTIDREYPPGKAPAGWWGLAANYQMDSDGAGDPMKTHVDNLSVTYQ